VLVTADPTALLTPQGRELLARLADASPAGRAGSPLAQAERLRREFPADLVALAMAQQELRKSAAAKFSRAADMLFTRAGYEQSSSEAIARYRADRLADACRGAIGRVADLCCGIGGDLIALAGAGEVLAVDRDEVHASLALHNAAVYGLADRVTPVVSDVRDVRLAGLAAVFIDPARRSGSATASAGPASANPARRFRAGLSDPPLDWCAGLTSQVAAVCVKAAPGLPADLVPPGWEAEFIAEGRDLKEAVLWSPALATAPVAAPPGGPPGPRRATVIAPAPAGPAPAGPVPGGPVPGGQAADGQPADYQPADDQAADDQSARCRVTLVAAPGDPVPLRAPGEYLLDPNPAVTRAGLVEDLARTLGGGAAKIDPQIAFLTLDRPAETPFARTLRVLESAPWHEREFARRLRDLGIGAVDIRRRGLAGDVDQIRRRLKLAGKDRATLVITRVDDKPWGMICTDPDGAAPV
jgi:SAM-dependent methyltransferase